MTDSGERLYSLINEIAGECLHNEVCPPQEVLSIFDKAQKLMDEHENKLIEYNAHIHGQNIVKQLSNGKS